MKENDCIIRLEKETDYRITEELVRESFWNVYRPGCVEHYVLKRMRELDAAVPELSFVMELGGKIIGQNVFVPACIKADDGEAVVIMTMGPICIANEFKRRGYGKKLLDYSVEKAREYGCGALCFEGNIDFYGKSGFRPASEFNIRYHGLPEGEDASFFLCRELKAGYLDGVSGEYATPEIYFICEREASDFEAYDRTFPKHERLRLPGQLN